MIGRFLEWSVATPDIRASLDFYGALGFAEASVGEAWTHPYAVLTDGRIHVGLHQNPDFESSATFVKPGLLRFLGDPVAADLTFEFRRLAADVFNEVGWLDPGGHLVRLVEARTFSPAERAAAEVSLCGYFNEIALPAPSRDAAKRHWERFGFVGLDEPDAVMPHVSCTSDTIDFGLYEPTHIRRPTLVFDVEDLEVTLRRLESTGATPTGRVPPPLKGHPAAVLTAPEGTTLLLLGRPDPP